MNSQYVVPVAEHFNMEESDDDDGDDDDDDDHDDTPTAINPDMPQAKNI